MNNKKTILIVDDVAQNLAVLASVLERDYDVRAANSGEKALRVVKSHPIPELILLDIMMPDMDGFEVIKRLQQDPETAEIPVIFITAMTAVADEKHGLELGAVDYITKPFNPAVVLLRVKTQLELKAARDRLTAEKQWLDAEVKRRTEEIVMVQELTMHALACIGEARDNETGLHIFRTQMYVRLMVEKLANHPRFHEALAGAKGQWIVQAAPLHDLGKVGIPDAILLKPGRLTEDEIQIMKTHPQIGADAIDRAIELSLAGANDQMQNLAESAFAYLKTAREISLSHHEKWDGSGYPQGLAAEAIPVSGRLMALADVFDALINKRVYKPAMSVEETTDIILEGKGKHFDPDIVDAFIDLRDEFLAIAREYADKQ